MYRPYAVITMMNLVNTATLQNYYVTDYIPCVYPVTYLFYLASPPPPPMLPCFPILLSWQWTCQSPKFQSELSMFRSLPLLYRLLATFRINPKLCPTFSLINLLQELWGRFPRSLYLYIYCVFHLGNSASPFKTKLQEASQNHPADPQSPD